MKLHYSFGSEKLTRRTILAAPALPLRQQARLNVVLLVAPRWRGVSMPADPNLNAPNLAQLVGQSHTFSRAYCANATRQAALGSILTGRFSHASTGSADIVAVFRRAGYTTLRIDESSIAGTGEQTNKAVEFVRSAKEPYCLVLAWAQPEVAGGHRRTELRPNVPEEVAFEAADFYEQYYARLAALDAQLGRILDVVSAERSVTVFTSGVGEMLGSHGLHGDGEPYEEAVRIPLLVRHFRLGKASEHSGAVSAIDVAPSLFKWCEVPAPDGLHGRDLLAREGRLESVYVQGRLGEPGEWRMVVRNFDKLVVDTKFDPRLLFNLARDNFELTNLAPERGNMRRVDELTAILKVWMRQTADRVPSRAPVVGSR